MRELTLDDALIAAERQAARDEEQLFDSDDLWSINAPLPVLDRLAKRSSRRGRTSTEGQSRGLS